MRMKTTPNSTSPKRPVNVTIDHELLKEAKSLGINVSSVARAALSIAIKEEKKRRYIEENKEAIAEYNAWVEANGVLITPIWERDDVTF